MGHMLKDKQEFVKVLAEYLAGSNSAYMSIMLQMENHQAIVWSNMRSKTPLSGWPSEEEAEKVLGAWLGIEMGS
jgi:hypothetical protein